MMHTTTGSVVRSARLTSSDWNACWPECSPANLVRLNDVTDTIREQLFDVDLLGHDLNTLTYETARKMIRYGHVGVLVDAPADGGRPYWVAYTPRDILGFRHENRRWHQQVVAARLRETIVKPDEDSEFGEEEIEQIRVLKPVNIRSINALKRKAIGRLLMSNDQPERNPVLGCIFQSRQRSGVRPPMEDIVELNLKAYQVQSDLTTGRTSAQFHVNFYGFIIR